MKIKICKCCQEQEIFEDNIKGLCSGCYDFLEEENRLNDYDKEEDIYIDTDDN